MKRALLRGVALVLIVLGLTYGRVVWSSRAAFVAAQAAEGDARVRKLGEAARLYAPGSPYARRALDALADIGRAGGGDALAAWREVRSAILATRSFYTPRPALLAEANAQLAERMAALETDARGPLDSRRAFHAARLAEDDAPSVAWSLVALVGLAAWIGSAVGFILRGLDDRDRLRTRPAVLFAAGVAVGLILFFVGLARA